MFKQVKTMVSRMQSPGGAVLRRGRSAVRAARPGSRFIALGSLMALVLLLALMSVGPICAELAEAKQAESDSFFGLCRTGSVEEVSAAIAAGADVNAADDRGWTPLMVVSGEGVEMATGKAELLLKSGADPNRVNNFKTTALHLAVSEGNLGVAEILLKGGAEVNAVNDIGDTPLMEACQKKPGWPDGLQESLLKLLLDAGADIQPGQSASEPDEGEPLLVLAAMQSGPEVIELLLDLGCPVDGVNSIGTTPLMVAAMLNPNPDTVAALLKAGADPNPNRRNDKGLSSLDMARLNKTPAAKEIVTMLEAALNGKSPQ